MSWFQKRESYEVRVVDGKRVLVPKDEKTERAVLKQMERQQRKPSGTPRLKEQIRLYNERERAKKIQRKKEFRKKWRRVTDTSRATMYPYKKKPKLKTTDKTRYVVVKGKAYPVARPPKKKKKEPDFSWDSVSKEMNEAFRGFKF